MTARYSVVALNNARTQSIAKLEFYSIGRGVRYPQVLFGVCEYFFVEYHHKKYTKREKLSGLSPER